MANRLQFRRGTAAQAVIDNPVLAEGELGYETDTSLVKFGDGVTAWNSLPYAQIQGVGISWQGTFTTAPSSPQLNWAYFDSTLGLSRIWDGSAWNNMTPGEGVPGGGTAGQTLVKQSATDFDVAWQDYSGMFDLIHPVGSRFIRLPGMSEPDAMGWPGTWVVDTTSAGRVFRVEDGGSLAPNYGATQEDAIKTMYFPASTNTSAGDCRSLNSASGWGLGGLSTTTTTVSYRTTTAAGSKYIINDASGGSWYPQATEVRVKSTGIQIWERTA
jgi:hypothetical protein